MCNLSQHSATEMCGLSILPLVKQSPHKFWLTVCEQLASPLWQQIRLWLWLWFDVLYIKYQIVDRYGIKADSHTEYNKSVYSCNCWLTVSLPTFCCYLPCCGLASAAISRYLLAARPAAAACGEWMGQTERQVWQLHRPCSTYYAGSASKGVWL